MKKKILSLVVLFFALASLSSVPADTSYVAYTNKTCYVYARASVGSAHIQLKKNTKIYVVDVSGRFYKIYNSIKTGRGFILQSNISRYRTFSPSWRSKVEKSDWFRGGNTILPVGSNAILYDVSSGSTFTIHRMGGTNHIDAEPLTAADTAKMKRICRSFSWNCRAAILKVGKRYIACSFNSMPHGQQTIEDNDYEGQFCIHFWNSRTHETDRISSEHQKKVKETYDWAHRNNTT